jgi:hypothetical protein
MDQAPAIIEKFASFYGVILFSIGAVVLGFLLKSGKLVVKTKSVTLGQVDVMERERTILRNQMSFLHISAEGMVSQLPPGLDLWRTKYVISKVCDVLEEAILYNHINRGDETYIKIKQRLVYNAVLKRTENVFFRSDDFKEMCDRFTRDMLTEFCNIRETYSKD